VLGPDERNAQRLIRTPTSPQWRTPELGPMADAVAHVEAGRQER
jgi:hypothetical protein